jgi:nitrate reductase gamma subunit
LDMNRVLKYVVAAIVLVGLCWFGNVSQADWFIDSARRHIGVHAEMTCLDCHEDITELDVHPSPANVSKDLRGFFEPDNCLDCHDDVMDDLEMGRHGKHERVDPARFQNCISCHNPHYLRLRDPDSKDAFDPGKPRTQQCGVCHENRDSLPEPSDEEADCLACHQAPEPSGPERKQRIEALCLTCHGPEGKAADKQTTALIDPKALAESPHGQYDCLTCHVLAASYRHNRQNSVNCLECHSRHGESEAGDAHLTVDCQACHFGGVTPVRNSRTGRITAKPVGPSDNVSDTHRLTDTDNDANCRRCHVSGNTLGAAAMELPAKSIMCMPCHTATLSVGDTVTIAALLIFLFGVIAAVSVWFTGASGPNGEASSFGAALGAMVRAIFSVRIFKIIKALIVDGLFQRKLYERSQGRWFIHALIFWPFVVRFTWGIIALAGSSWAPDVQFFQDMVNKNYPATAAIFDITGVLVILGVVLAIIRRIFASRMGISSGLPKQDRLALALLGGIVIVGFFLEGMRMAMTMVPADVASYAFVGQAVSRLFAGAPWLNDVYGYVWYLHAILTGAFVAYLPFSRMFHIIIGPLGAAVSAGAEGHHE